MYVEVNKVIHDTFNAFNKSICYYLYMCFDTCALILQKRKEYYEKNKEILLKKAQRIL